MFFQIKSKKSKQALVPGASRQNHIIIKNASHFVQEDKGPELVEVIVEFIKINP